MSSKEHNTDKKYTGALIMLITAMIIYGSVGIFRRFIPLSSSILACYRGFMGTLVLVVLARIQKKKLRHGIGKKKVLMLVVTGGMIGFNWILLFEAYNYTKVATATLCYYMQPTIVVLLAPIFFKERVTMKKGICAIVALIGMVLISGMVESGIPSMEEASGILLGLGAALLYAAVVILNKKMPGIDAYEKTTIQLFSAAIVLLPYLFLTHQSFQMELTAVNVILLLIIGIVHTGIAYVLYFGSMDHLKAQTIAVFGYLDPITALILASLILQEKMSVYEWIGALLILGAALISELKVGERHE